MFSSAAAADDDGDTDDGEDMSATSDCSFYDSAQCIFFIFVYGNVFIARIPQETNVFQQTPSLSRTVLPSFVRRLKPRRRQSPYSWYGRANRLYSVFLSYLSLCSLAWSSMAVLQLPSIRVLYVLQKQKDDASLPCSKRSMV